jgi:uncharacterized protein (DUF1330 family)
MTLIKVRAVKPLGGHRLWFEFSDGSQVKRDFGDLVHKDRPVLEPLRDRLISRGFSSSAARRPGRTDSISRPGRSMTTWSATKRSPARLMPPDPAHRKGTPMPKGYIVARIVVTDPEKYAEYVKDASEAIRKYGGRPLVRGGTYEELEGEGRPRNVVIEFESLEQAKRYYRSPEYQAAKRKREGAGLADIVAVEGAA